MDTLAPITREGYQYLFDDNSTKIVWDDERTNEQYEMATEEEKHLFYNRMGYLFKGDKVKIVKGRKMVGETKTINGFWKYVVPGTYGKIYTEYVYFTDGTKVNQDYVRVVDCDYFDEDVHIFSKFQILSIGGRL